MSEQTSSSLIGTWRPTSVSRLVLETGEIEHPYGEDLTGYLQYSPSGHMIAFGGRADVAKPTSLVFTDAERAEFWNNIFAGYAGPYSVEGNKVVHHVIAAWRPDWVGTDQVRFFELNGSELRIKTAPIRSSETGKDYVATLTLEKVG